MYEIPNTKSFSSFDFEDPLNTTVPYDFNDFNTSGSLPISPIKKDIKSIDLSMTCLLYTSPSPRDRS